MTKRNMSGQEAINEGFITEEQWQQAIAHPWTWVIISDAVKVREIPWNGLEVEACDDITCGCCGKTIPKTANETTLCHECELHEQAYMKAYEPPSERLP